MPEDERSPSVWNLRRARRSGHRYTKRPEEKESTVDGEREREKEDEASPVARGTRKIDLSGISIYRVKTPWGRTIDVYRGEKKKEGREMELRLSRSGASLCFCESLALSVFIIYNNTYAYTPAANDPDT